MVRTLRPKASETPNSPIPTCGKAAAITALPQPAKVSQKVPIPSARYLRVFMGSTLRQVTKALSAGAMAADMPVSQASERGCAVD